MSVGENLKKIRDSVEEITKTFGREPNSVKILPISKTVDAEVVKEAIIYGLDSAGENKPQELVKKYEVIGDQIKWHLVGQLQSNKVRQIIDKVDLIHSVDRISLCDEIEKRAKRIGRLVEILIQVNITKEESKSGVYEEFAEKLIEDISKNYNNIKVVGLMTMAPNTDDEQVIRDCFRRLKKLAEKVDSLGLENIEMRELSMGMSKDYKIAIEEGATIIRIGTAIFGPRQKSK